VALALAMSTWFSTAAVLGQLRRAWNLSNTEASWLTISVQISTDDDRRPDRRPRVPR